jgi:hypothetical protein
MLFRISSQIITSSSTTRIEIECSVTKPPVGFEDEARFLS